MEPRGGTRALASAFAAPGARFSPVPIWWWSGDQLEADRLRWQMEQLLAGGIHSAVVLNLAPSGPLYGALADSPEFFSDWWWQLFEGVCGDAADRGFSLWFYDQLGFSGADVQGRLVRAEPRWRGQHLDRVTAVATGPTVVRAPPGTDVLGAFAVPVDGDGRATGPPTQLQPEGQAVHFRGRGRHRVSLAFAVDRAFDYLSPQACAALFDTVHGEFERRVGRWFGSTIVGSFQDELASLPSWTRGFDAEFARRRGYPLEERIAALWEATADDAAGVRGDYHRTRSELAEEAFFRPLHEWHERRGLVVGCDQQHPARAGYPLEASQQYGDYFRTHRWFTAPGSDHWGDAKIHSSIAHLYGRPRTWVEAFHSTGWGGTIEETFDWLVPWLRAGATLYDPHAVYYSTRGSSWEWAPPSTCWRQPYWRHYPLFADAVARLCAALSWGHHVCDVAVLFPTATVQADLAVDDPEELFGRARGTAPAQDTYLAVVGTMHWYDPSPGALDRDRRDFDVIDDDSLTRATIEGNALVVGHERFAVLILPGCRVIEEPTLEAVTAFARAGGTVIVVGEAPVATAGSGHGGAALRAFAALLDDGVVRFTPNVDGLTHALWDVPRRVTAPTPTLLRSDGESSLLFVPAAYPCATVADKDWRTDGYDFDATRYRRAVPVTVRGVARPVAMWDPGTGTTRRLVAKDAPGGLELDVPLDAGPCALVVFGPAADSDLPSPRSEERDVRMAEVGTAPAAPTAVTDWSATLVPTMDNRWGDFAVGPSSRVLPQVWHLDHYVGATPLPDGSWSSVRVTEGVWAVVAGPARAADLPDPLPPERAHGCDVTGSGWRPVVYSEVTGRPVTAGETDPKGFVPEEFLDLGTVDGGETVQVRIPVDCAATGPAQLTIGASAEKQAWWNGRPVEFEESVYYAGAAVAAVQGANLLEIRLTAPTTRRVRASWQLTHCAVSRPEWLTTPSGAAAPSTLQKIVHVAAAPDEAKLQFGSIGRVRLTINGVVIAEHGEFDNYAHVRAPRVRRYDVSGLLAGGDNGIEIELSEPAAAAVVDAVVTLERRRVELVTDGSWQAGSSATAVEGLPEVPHDPRWVQLHPRPHPLRHGGRLQGVVDDSPVGAPAGVAAGRRTEWFRFRLPPGVTALRLPVAGLVDVSVVGVDVQEQDGEHLLSAPVPAGTPCVVRVEVDVGSSGGALWSGPVEVTRWEQGAIRLADWCELGLGDYSGGLRYRTVVSAPADIHVVDLGRVRGTAELRVNGCRAGARIWSPYRFDVSGLFRDGDNELEVDVFNTLAPHFGAAGTTPWVLPGQRVSGLLGPVVLRAGNAAAGSEVM